MEKYFYTILNNIFNTLQAKRAEIKLKYPKGG